MPIHDWTSIDAPLFHAFHQSWIVKLCSALNGGLLPSSHFASPEVAIGGPISETRSPSLLLEEADVIVAEQFACVQKADRVAVKDKLRQTVAVIEIVSPGNKANPEELRTFIKRASHLIGRGIHLLVIDLFPPTQYDPFGIHKAIWDEFADEAFELPTDNHVLLAAYMSESPVSAFVDTVSLGSKLPDMPLFLKGDLHVAVPLEASYQATWAEFPAPMKRLLDSPGAGTTDDV